MDRASTKEANSNTKDNGKIMSGMDKESWQIKIKSSIQVFSKEISFFKVEFSIKVGIGTKVR